MDTFSKSQERRLAIQRTALWSPDESHAECTLCGLQGEYVGDTKHGVYKDHKFQCDNCGTTWCYISEGSMLLRLQVEYKKI